MCTRLSGQKHITLQHLLGKVGVMIDPPPITGHKAGKNGSEMKRKRLKHQSSCDKCFRETVRFHVFTVGHVPMPFPFPPRGWNHIFLAFSVVRGYGERSVPTFSCPGPSLTLFPFFQAKIFIINQPRSTETVLAVSRAAFVESNHFLPHETKIYNNPHSPTVSSSLSIVTLIVLE